MFYVYLLESLVDCSWYIGYSSDLKARVLKHNSGGNISTKGKRPWKIIYYEAYINKMDAEGRERYLKSGSGRKYIKRQLNNYLKS